MSNGSDYVFLHGGGQGSWVWQETIAALERQSEHTGKSVPLDVPGCGVKRSRSINDLSIDDIAHELLDDIEAAGANDVVLVGHSQAGQAMSFMVKRRPALFRRLIYVSCSAPLGGQNVQAMIGAGLHGANSAAVGWPIDPKTSH